MSMRHTMHHKLTVISEPASHPGLLSKVFSAIRSHRGQPPLPTTAETVPMKRNTDTGFIVSLHHDASPDTLRVNLKWEGDHDISAFDLGSLGEVLHCENESVNTGWAIVTSSNLVSPGEAIPSQKRAENLDLRNSNSSLLTFFQLSLFQR